MKCKESKYSIALCYVISIYEFTHKNVRFCDFYFMTYKLLAKLVSSINLT